MGFHRTESLSRESHPTAKNRVWGFLGDAQETTRKNRPQSLQPRRENRPTTTKVASGRAYWPSRNPIGKDGGINLYGMVGNDPIGRWDLLGLIDLADLNEGALCGPGKCCFGKGSDITATYESNGGGDSPWGVDRHLQMAGSLNNSENLIGAVEGGGNPNKATSAQNLPGHRAGKINVKFEAAGEICLEATITVK